tara:strand:- start:827 stop:1858 length:1032 start_codon:yes stop_codon:yes gene_type:complete
LDIHSSTILVTGAAGFIGSALSKKLLKEGCKVHGLDNVNNYYDQKLKFDRLKDVENVNEKNWDFSQISITDKRALDNLFEKEKFKIVVNLAAQAGVRYSIENPYAYLDSNVIGFMNILEAAKNYKVQNLIYASSSSVYGSSQNIPFKENQCVSSPVSFYAATKSSNELFAHSYSHLYGIPTIGLRFFTVYGPWGRPDMAPMIFTKSIFENKRINIFNYGNMNRDFTYIDDVVESIFRCCSKPANYQQEIKNKKIVPELSPSSHKIFNVGNSHPINLNEFVKTIEKYTGFTANKNLCEIQKGDVHTTYADTDLLEKWTGYKPTTTLNCGIKRFVDWYVNYYGLN